MKIKIKKLVLSALMTALCIIIGLVCKRFLTFGAIRITFENIPVLLAGIWLGPVCGAAVGMAADLISAPLSGFGINPVITLGAASIGAVSGIVFKYVFKRKITFLSLMLSVLSAHTVGSMVVKSLGLYFMGYAWQLLAARIPLYIAIGLAESYIIYILLKNKLFKEAL